MTSVGAPTAVTLAASGITPNSATLNGTVNPNGAIAAAYFQYGLTTNYDNYSATNTLLATNIALSVSNIVGSLSPGTIYHFQLVASNSAGISLGSDLTFTTQPAPPAVTTLSASSITPTDATLNGTANPIGGATRGLFPVRLDDELRQLQHHEQSGCDQHVNIRIQPRRQFVTGDDLSFRLWPRNSAGTSFADDLIFTTSAGAPTGDHPRRHRDYRQRRDAQRHAQNRRVDRLGILPYGLTTNYGSYSATNTLDATDVHAIRGQPH